MVYDHVAIDIAPNFGGLSGSVPSNISQGQIVTHTINTTLPSSMQNENHVWVNVLLLDNNNEGVVVNANYKKLTNKVGLDENDKVVASVYPNPATDFFSVELEENTDFSLELINTVGQIVYRAAFTDSKDAVVNTADLAKGMYILNIRSGNGVSSTERSRYPISLFGLNFLKSHAPGRGYFFCLTNISEYALFSEDHGPVPFYTLASTGAGKIA
ncbi:MAG: T9SS type A sorting domain-containing protein [Owenweeksia sp.]|nr:T9SS type A sorting domain-containing protein [Owenweeksia sp.]